MPNIALWEQAKIEYTPPTTGRYAYDSDYQRMFDCADMGFIRATYMCPGGKCGHDAEMHVLVPIPIEYLNTAPLSEILEEVKWEVAEGIEITKPYVSSAYCNACAPVQQTKFEDDVSNSNWQLVKDAGATCLNS